MEKVKVFYNAECVIYGDNPPDTSAAARFVVRKSKKNACAARCAVRKVEWKSIKSCKKGESEEKNN